MKVGSLFSGIGGFDLGLERAGMEVVWQVEIDDYCNQVLEKHWPTIGKHRDVKTFTLDTAVSLSYNQLNKRDQGLVNVGAKRKDYDEAVKMYNKGLSVGEVADYYNITRQGMWQILKIRGCEFRPNLKYGKENHFHRGTSDDKRAQHLVEKAIKKGIIERKPCEVCSTSGKMKDGRNKVQAHHDDYNKPLDIRWLCQECHHQWHKDNKAIPRKEVMPDEAIAKTTTDVICGGFP